MGLAVPNLSVVLGVLYYLAAQLGHPHVAVHLLLAEDVHVNVFVVLGHLVEAADFKRVPHDEVSVLAGRNAALHLVYARKLRRPQAHHPAQRAQNPLRVLINMLVVALLAV